MIEWYKREVFRTTNQEEVIRLHKNWKCLVKDVPEIGGWLESPDSQASPRQRFPFGSIGLQPSAYKVLWLLGVERLSTKEAGEQLCLVRRKSLYDKLFSLKKAILKQPSGDIHQVILKAIENRIIPPPGWIEANRKRVDCSSCRLIGGDVPRVDPAFEI